MPSKAKKTQKLDSDNEKKLNREIGRRRIQVEHVFWRIKCLVFILGVYRNRRKTIKPAV